MSYISADIKYMPKGIYNYDFLLVIVCEITGFVLPIPLIKHDAVTIAHALLEKVIFLFGPPQTLIIDEYRALSAKVMHYILDALKVNVKLVSPSNHGSLKTERYIQTINNLITRQLTGKGREWPLYVTSTLLNIGSIRIYILMTGVVSNETNEDVRMYIEEFILVEIWIHCCTKLN